MLSRNPSRKAISLLEKNPDKIDYHRLSENTSPHAISLLVKNPLRIDWNYLSGNPSLFAVDTNKFNILKKEFSCWLTKLKH